MAVTKIMIFHFKNVYLPEICIFIVLRTAILIIVFYQYLFIYIWDMCGVHNTSDTKVNIFKTIIAHLTLFVLDIQKYICTWNLISMTLSLVIYNMMPIYVYIGYLYIVIGHYRLVKVFSQRISSLIDQYQSLVYN